MLIDLTMDELDDPTFVDVVGRVLDGAVRCYGPRQVYVIQLDNWFDHKWKSYAGRLGYCCNVWLDPLRPPPFSPNRVRSQAVYERSAVEPFEFDRTKAPPLHVWQNSSDNSHRRLKAISPAGLYFWYSGNTQKTDRGSVMVYSVQGDENLGWYASLLRDGDDWKIGRTKGISPNELRFFMGSD